MGKTNNILYVLPGQNFQDEEYFESKKIFEGAGYKTEVSSTFIGTANGKLGGITNIDLLFSEVDAVEFDAVVFIGGIGLYIGVAGRLLNPVYVLNDRAEHFEGDYAAHADKVES